jgi:hydrogenase-4 membrane subunit HyfE
MSLELPYEHGRVIKALVFLFWMLAIPLLFTAGILLTVMFVFMGITLIIKNGVNIFSLFAIFAGLLYSVLMIVSSLQCALGWYRYFNNKKK